MHKEECLKLIVHYHNNLIFIKYYKKKVQFYKHQQFKII